MLPSDAYSLLYIGHDTDSQATRHCADAFPERHHRGVECQDYDTETMQRRRSLCKVGGGIIRKALSESSMWSIGYHSLECSMKQRDISSESFLRARHRR